MCFAKNKLHSKQRANEGTKISKKKVIVKIDSPQGHYKNVAFTF